MYSSVYLLLFIFLISSSFSLKVPKRTLGHLLVTNLDIEFTDPAILKENPCGPNDECNLLLRFCAGTLYPSRPELNKCDYLLHERAFTQGETDMKLRFEELWTTKPWQLDISIGTTKRKFIFEVFQSFNKTNAASGSFTFNSESNEAKVTATLQLKCIANRFGPSCEQLCDLTGFDTSRWMCNSRGKRICQYGWTGQNCSDFYCPASCLMGDCVGPNDCKCRAGFSGQHCEKGNFCHPHDTETACSGNGYCVKEAPSLQDRTQKYRKTGKDLNGTCNCYPGYKGNKCEKIIKNYNITKVDDKVDSDEELFTELPSATIQKDSSSSRIFLVTLLVVMILGVATLAYVMVSNKRIRKLVRLSETTIDTEWEHVHELPRLLEDSPVSELNMNRVDVEA